MTKKKTIILVVIINLLIFTIANLLFTLKYEQVDDFIIYNMYSGLDGTFNVHGIYIHPILCAFIGFFYKIFSMINWHSIFLLLMQFICFTLIGYRLLRKHQNGVAIVAYTLFASVFYTVLLMLIQYTSVAALLILTSVFLIIDIIETKEEKSLTYKITVFALFTIGLMLRIQSLIIIVPYMLIYFLIKIIQYFRKKDNKAQIKGILKYYSICIVLTLFVSISSSLIYNSDEIYKKYMEYNGIRSNLHDINYISYDENKEIFDEIGWSKNDHYLFYTFGFGDEQKYSKENLQKILDYKIKKDGNYSFNFDLQDVFKQFSIGVKNDNTYISLLFLFVFIISFVLNKKRNWQNILIFITTISLHLFFIVLGRSMLRVVIPEYIIGTLLIIYNFKLEKKENCNYSFIKCATVFITLVFLVNLNGLKYKYNYNIKDYQSIRDIIQYTSEHKDNVYLYTVPSLQYRYLAYNVYEMPPKQSFSNLRVIGGWDMFTGNYYDFKKAHNLNGNLLDLLKDNVYLIDGKVIWSGQYFDNYKANILFAIKQNYGIKAKCELIKQFDNLSIYKVKTYDS